MLIAEAYKRTLLEPCGLADTFPRNTPAEGSRIIQRRCPRRKFVFKGHNAIQIGKESTAVFRQDSKAGYRACSDCGDDKRVHHSLGPRGMAKPKRLFRYFIVASWDFTYREGPDAENGGDMEAYVDVDHAGDKEKGFPDSRSRTFLVLYAGVPLVRGSKL